MAKIESISAQSGLERLKEGVRTFQRETFARRADRYRQAAHQPQRPHTLMIACADSRVDPQALVSAGPGDVFVARNIGNMVPVYGDSPDGMSAVIEYAIRVLEVQQIVICGHTECGAMKALEHPDDLRSLPAVSTWIKNSVDSKTVAEILAGRSDTPQQKLRHLIERNVLLQMQQLQTHPSVAAALKRNDLAVSGWVYDIATGSVAIAEGEGQAFTPLG